MSAEDGDKVVESSSLSSNKAESASREAEAGKSELIATAKQLYKDLKDGISKSGISDIFGKPDLTDSGLQAVGKAPEAAKNVLANEGTGAAAEAVGKLVKNFDPEMAGTGAGLKELGKAFEQSKGEQGSLKDIGKAFEQAKSEHGGLKDIGKAYEQAKGEPGGLKDVPVQKDEPGMSSGAKAKDIEVKKEQSTDKGKDANSDKRSFVDDLKNFDPEMATMKAGKLPGKSADAADAKKDGVDNQTKESAENPELQKIKDAKLPMSPEKEAQLKKDMAEIDKLPEDQRKKVYESLDKIATADTKDSTKLTPEQRAELVSSVAHQIAHPEDIKQGQRDTCVAANVEKTIAMSHPDRYAQMAADLATKGEYTTPDGKTTMKAQRDADGKLAEASDPSGKRSAASDVLQTAITNVGMPADEGEYRSYKPKDDKDSGEKVKHADGKETPFEGLPRTAKEDILGKLCPEDGYKARKIQSPDDLGQAWKDNGEKPPLNVTVRINADHTGMGESKDGSAGTHAVSITHMDFGPDGKPTAVYYENTADGTDHSYPNGKPVPIDDFVKSMQGERFNTYKTDGKTDVWSEPMTATVRTDGDDNRAGKVQKAKDEELDKAVADFRDSTHKDAFFFDYGTNYDEMRDSLKNRPRWEIEEINRRYKEKYGHTLEEEIVDETSGKTRVEMRQLLKGTDTTTYEPKKR